MDAKETLIRIVLLALMLYAAACLGSARRELAAAQGAEEALRIRLEAVEQENLAAGRRLAQGWSAEELEQLARDRLGLVLPGDRIFRFPKEEPERENGTLPG